MDRLKTWEEFWWLKRNKIKIFWILSLLSLCRHLDLVEEIRDYNRGGEKDL